MLRELWALVRAGRLAEARTLCTQTGQAWRAASLGGGGAFGPTPLGKHGHVSHLQVDSKRPGCACEAAVLQSLVVT